MLLILLACGGSETPVAATPAPAPAPAGPVPALATDASPTKAPTVVPALPNPDPAHAAADEKFNKAMKLAESNGDSAAAVKEALDAYAALPKLDGDARFHVAVLQSAAGDYPDATKSCELLLKEHPNHLLAIGAAARASKKAGDTAAAKTWYQRYVDAWGAPREDLPEYKEHNRLLTIYQKEAVAFLAEAG